MSITQITVVIPCLNEAKTIASVIAEALEGISKAGLTGEVVVSDNGSTDGSQALATNAGARVIAAPIRGYGAALHYGVLAAQSEWVIFGDADMSYDFRLLPRFKHFIEGKEERDLVLGTRLKGEVLPGAMPFLNRHLGTPVLNWVIWLFFGLRTTDCNSGMRLMRREFYKTLHMRAPGMEWASELLIKAKIMNMRYAEVPITLRPDQRGRPPHLRRWRDGWRHLKTIVLLSPNRLILLPSLLIGAFSLVLLANQNAMWGAVAYIIGLAGLFLSFFVKLVLHADRVRSSNLIGWLIEKPAAEWMLWLGAVSCLAGILTGALNHSSDFSIAPLLLTTSGALLILCSFAWGTLITHFVRKLEDRG